MAEGRNVKNENWDEEIFSRRLEFSLLLFMEFFYYCFPFPSPKKEMEFSVIEDLDFSMIEIIRDRGSRLIFSRRKNFEIRHRNFPRDVRQSSQSGVIFDSFEIVLKFWKLKISLEQPLSQILSVLFSRSYLDLRIARWKIWLMRFRYEFIRASWKTRTYVTFLRACYFTPI